jgi:uncharacterized protein YqgC (DUF456 family)
MDLLWIILGGFLMVVGIIGCVLPLLPGPPLCYLGLLVQQLKEADPFSSRFLWIWAGITAVVVILEYVIPLYGTRRFGGTKYGMWGCAIGVVAGIFLGPLGLIVGPFVGALIGELIGNAQTDKAIRAAFGSFVGFVAGTLLKLIACLVITYYYILSIFNADITW